MNARHTTRFPEYFGSGQVVVWLLVLSILAGVAAYFTMLTGLTPFDDEGALMLSIKQNLSGTRLYRDLFSIYGPAYYCYNFLIRTFTATPVTHDVTRMSSIFPLVVCSLLCASIVFRLTKSLVFAAATLFIVSRHLAFFHGEPGHTHELTLVLLTGFVACPLWKSLADRRRLFPCAVLPIQSVEHSIEELRRVARRGFKAAAVRPCFWNGRYPTLPEFDPLWREFETTGVVLAMHTFPSREALTPDWGQRMAQARGHSGQGLMFTDEAVVYSPGQFVSNITAAMDPAIDASETLGFLMEAMTWVTVVVQTGWLEKFPTLKAAVLESNASWLPLVLARCSNFSNLFAFQRDNRLIRDPVDVFNERCFIGFESDETLVYRLWDVFQDVAIWSSDYPHHDAEDAWDGLHHMAEFGVPAEAQQKLMGENARRLYGIEPVLTVHERIETYEPAILPW
jgi:predicted TIM-barrel fold metal-dependent hydrolase